MTIVITPVASRDLDEIYSYIASEHPVAARRVALKVIEAIKRLDINPGIGRPSQDGKRREWSVPGLPFVIPYRVAGNRIIIIRVFHTSRLRPPQW